MRIVIDFQGAQTSSRYRGIGRYSTELVKALVRHSPSDEFILALNGSMPETVEPIRASFDGILPQSNIRVWYTPAPIERFDREAGPVRRVAEAMREHFLRSLDPDLVLITSIFEGLFDQSVVTVNEFFTDVPTAAIFYDLTPLIMPDDHFKSDPAYRRWYRHRIEQLRKCDLLLSISESSRSELLSHIDYPADKVVTILGGHNEGFTQRQYTPQQRQDLMRRFGIKKPFILHIGGSEGNKNVKALMSALHYLPPKLQKDFEFICAGRTDVNEIARLNQYASDAATRNMFRIIGYLNQSELADLYSLASLFVFPSLREGLGLPPLEAMACGTPTIASDRTSLPEILNNSDALFDPESPESIARKIVQVLTNQSLAAKLSESGLREAKRFTWKKTAEKTMAAIKERFATRVSFDASRRAIATQTGIFRSDKKKILVQKLDHHGDFLLAIPALAKLRARYPEAQIDALVGSWNKAAAEATGLVDQVFTLDFFKSQSSVRPEIDDDELDQLVAGMPYYDYAVDLRRTDETRFILCQVPASQYFGYRTHDQRINDLLTRPLELHPDNSAQRSYFDETHMCEQILRIIDALPFDVNDYLHLPDLGDRQEVVAGSIAIFPRVGNDSRQWHSEYFDQLINSLAACDAVSQIDLYVGRSEELSVFAFKPNKKIRVRAGLRFAELFSSLSAHPVCVGNNSFGVHLASYAGCRTIGIYSGHELPQQWGPPFGESVAITVDAHCSPCHLADRKSCPNDLFCLSDISVETVRGLVVDALAGKPMPREYSRMTRTNPARAVKPLVDAVNKSKFKGKLEGLSHEQRVAFAAAVATNFPDRTSAEPCIFVDATAMVDPDVLERSSGRSKSLNETVSLLRGSGMGRVIPIATAQHDHEFYAVELSDIQGSLHHPERFAQVVRPMAGDTYIGPHVYMMRNPAQWNLITTWRQMGIRVLFAAPEALDVVALVQQDRKSRALASYLFAIAGFDGILVSDKDHAQLADWIGEFGPPRLRAIEYGSNWLSLLREGSEKLAPGALTALTGNQFQSHSRSLQRKSAELSLATERESLQVRRN